MWIEQSFARRQTAAIRRRRHVRARALLRLRTQVGPEIIRCRRSHLCRRRMKRSPHKSNKSHCHYLWFLYTFFYGVNCDRYAGNPRTIDAPRRQRTPRIRRLRVAARFYLQVKFIRDHLRVFDDFHLAVTDVIMNHHRETSRQRRGANRTTDYCD